jgi:alpha-tubulin suppressor-like RCC1 family protein
VGRALLAVLLLASCYRVDAVECSITCAGGSCPSGLTCRDDGYCHSSDHTASCEGGGDGGSDASSDGLADAPGCSTRMTAVVAGFKHTCALAEDGAVWCWGSNDFGQHGDGLTEPKPTPTRMVNWPPAVRLAAGQHHLCVLGQTGRIHCAGNNQAGQLGDGTTEYAGVPVETVGLSVIDQVASSGGYNTCARSGGQLWCWGDNGQGQVGDGTMEQRHLPVRVMGIDNGASLGSGWRHACAVRTGGSVYCWGYGALGNGAPEPQQSPIPVQAASTGFESLAGGLDDACGVKMDGTVHCWGWNIDGQCGTGTTMPALSPTATGVTAAAAVSMGPYHTCARLDDGTVSCWGQNERGQLGNGVATIAPVTVPALVAGVGEVTDLELGEDYSCVVRADGAVLCWGGNDEHQLGDGTIETRTAPIQPVFTCPD